MPQTDLFETERPRLLGLAARVLSDPFEAEDVVQQAWLRLHGTDADIDNLPAWLTTAPRLRDRLALKAPHEPAELDVGQVLEHLQGCPARRQAAGAQLPFRQSLDLDDHHGAEVVQVAEEDLST